ncbi:MAG: hypothetical protein NTW42_09525 [Deltaproteobacteria bacterium]|nr:hypothetical protein [Deltaproteobacteria bacterium]
MAILLGCEVKADVTRIGAFVKETIAIIIPPGVDLNQEERYFLSGLIFSSLGRGEQPKAEY